MRIGSGNCSRSPRVTRRGARGFGTHRRRFVVRTFGTSSVVRRTTVGQSGRRVYARQHRIDSQSPVQVANAIRIVRQYQRGDLVLQLAANKRIHIPLVGVIQASDSQHTTRPNDTGRRVDEQPSADCLQPVAHRPGPCVVVVVAQHCEHAIPRLEATELGGHCG